MIDQIFPKVSENVRTISLELGPDQAQEMATWIGEMGRAHPDGPAWTPGIPINIKTLYAALMAVADSRGYGGH